MWMAQFVQVEKDCRVFVNKGQLQYFVLAHTYNNYFVDTMMDQTKHFQPVVNNGLCFICDQA